MFSIMAFMFLVFLGIALILFYMLRVSERRHNILREEIAKTQDMLRALEARLPARAADAPAITQGAGDNATPDCAIDGPLTMDEAGTPQKPNGFDSGLDLHFNPESNK